MQLVASVIIPPGEAARCSIWGLHGVMSHVYLKYLVNWGSKTTMLINVIVPSSALFLYLP